MGCLSAACATCLALCAAMLPGAELKLLSGKKIPYDELILAVESPIAFATTKTAEGVNVFKYSEVNLEALPEKDRVAAKAYIASKLLERLIIKDDRWTHRDEMLLNADPRYAAKGKLAKFGPSTIEFRNTTDGMVTLGVRSNDKGWEMHLAAGKKKGYPVPNGKVFYIMAQESKDGTQLMVQKSEATDLQNVRLQVTILRSDEIPKGELGTIDIPAQYQVH